MRPNRLGSGARARNVLVHGVAQGVEHEDDGGPEHEQAPEGLQREKHTERNAHDGQGAVHPHVENVNAHSRTRNGGAKDKRVGVKPQIQGSLN